MTKKQIFIFLFILIGITACDDNEASGSGNEKGNYPVTSFNKIQLSANNPFELGAPPVTTTQTYLFNRSKLTEYIIQQNYTVLNEPTEIKNTTTLIYNDREVAVTDDAGNLSTYTLNDEGYAMKCTQQEGSSIRIYTFSYLINTKGKYYLEKITESINGREDYASVKIDYSTPGTMRITQKVDTYQQAYTATTVTTNNEIANLSEIPCLFLTELYPLTLHSAALYGKLLGEPFDILIEQITPDGNAESNETVKYTYQTNAYGVVTSVQEVTNSYGTNYLRTVNYVIE